jgi:integrase
MNMAITNYVSDSGDTLWKVYVNIRSKTHSAIRAQRRLQGVKTQREAGREETRLVRECEREIAEKESRGESFGAVASAFEAFLHSPDSTVHRTTREDYVAAIKKHMGGWWQREAASITPLDVRELFTQLKTTGMSLGHLNKIKVVLNQIFNYGIENRLVHGIDRSPVLGIKLGKDAEKKPEILSLTEIRKLLESARALAHPWYPVWALALLTGMRSGELYALTWDDVDWENNSITVSKSYNGRLKTIKSTKAGYWRAVPVSPALKRLLQEIKSSAGDRLPVLPRFNKWTKGLQAKELRKFCMGIGLPSVRFHALRACFATQLIRSGVPPIQIQKICGWRDLKTMQRYIRLAGIEIEGATDGLIILPDLELSAKAVSLFTDGTMKSAE